MNKYLSLMGGISMACASAMASADAFLDLAPSLINSNLVMPLFTNTDTDMDGNPDKLSMRFKVYTAGSTSRLVSTKPRTTAYPAAPCTSATSKTSEYSKRYAGLDGKARRFMILDMVTTCTESGSGEEKAAHRAVLYSANTGTGASWIKTWNSWGVKGAGSVDWDSDGTQEVQLFLYKGNSGRMLFVRMSDGTVEADNTYKIASSTSSGSSGLTLTSADEPGIGPCPNQTQLTDTTKFAALKTALTNNSNTIYYLDVPFDGTDPDIYKKKCGLEGYWNPADNTDEITAAAVGLNQSTLNLYDLLFTGHAGICASGFNNGSFNSGEGFPVAGTYRKELKVASGANTYHIRFRVAASGSSAGNTFASESIDGNTMQNTLVYKVNGSTTSYANLTDAVLNGFTVAAAGQAPTVQFTVQKSAATPVIFTAKAEMICATKQ